MVNWIVSNHLGDFASIAGIFITIIGFIITINSIMKSRNAVAKVRQDISKIDITTQLSSTIAIIDEIIRLQREAAWDVVQDRYRQVRRSILEIKMIDLPMVKSLQPDLQDSIAQIKAIENLLMKSKLSQTMLEPKLPVIHVVLTNTSDRLTELLQSIKTEIGK
jgi:hypothetical protein